MKDFLEEKLAHEIEGKCSIDGFIKPHSVKVISFSSGLVERGNFVSFEIVYECDVCFPVEASIINCQVKNITKAGIRAECSDQVPSPVVIFIARDHNTQNNYFNSIKVDDFINIRVIGQRFELNDKFVSVLGDLVKNNNTNNNNNNEKPKLVIEDFE